MGARNHATVCLAVVAILALLASTPLVAGDAKTEGETRNVKFHSQMRVGDAVLAAGDYRVQAVAEGDQHALVFKKNGKAPELRVKCSLAPLPQKAAQTQQLYNLGKNGEPVLVGLIFEGESVKRTF